MILRKFSSRGTGVQDTHSDIRPEDNKLLFEILKPERIGITLTEEWQMVPEQTTNAIVVHHPEAKYFFIK